MPSVQSDLLWETTLQDCDEYPVSRMVYTTSHRIHTHNVYVERGSLIDRGANGGLLGKDARVIHYHQKEVDVTGIDNHELGGLRMVDATARVMTQKGPVILCMRQYAYHGVGRTIHSCAQIEHFGNQIDDKSYHVGGRQCITTPDGYVIPFNIKNGLPYLPMRPNTQEEFESLPHVNLTSGEEWDPTTLDYDLLGQEGWYNRIRKEDDDASQDKPFDDHGYYKSRELVVPGAPAVDPIAEAEDTDTSVFASVTTSLRECYYACCNLNRTGLEVIDLTKPEVIDLTGENDEDSGQYGH